MKKIFLTLSLMVGMTVLSSFTTSNNTAEKVQPLYAVTITTTCGETSTMLIGGTGQFDTVYDAAMFLEDIWCD